MTIRNVLLSLEKRLKVRTVEAVKTSLRCPRRAVILWPEAIQDGVNGDVSALCVVRDITSKPRAWPITRYRSRWSDVRANDWAPDVSADRKDRTAVVTESKHSMVSVDVYPRSVPPSESSHIIQLAGFTVTFISWTWVSYNVSWTNCRWFGFYGFEIDFW